ncbi:type 4a pilus biogenesis protein PilO [Virgibacillus xinjiangensis]|uniref:Type 4a pilus biogenesis protein PilO n=1 Tax=Virgibacillus xinjiangensis TaxID=393090 RepID=A0ABV7CV34_9BACI
MRKWNKGDVLAVSTVIFASILAYVGMNSLFIQPVAEEVESTSRQAKQFQGQYEQLLEAREQAETDQELAAVREQVPAREAPESILRNLEALTGGTGVTIDHLAEGENTADEEAPLAELTYTLQASAASLGEINLFMEEMEQSDRLMLIDGFQLQKGEDAVTVSLSFTAYYSG